MTVVTTTTPTARSGGTTSAPRSGDVLTASATGVSGSPSPTASYQWYCGATAIGTNSATYTVTSANAAAGCVFTVKITETNGVSPSANKTSSPTGAAVAPPAITSASISDGGQGGGTTSAPRAGDVLTASATGVSGSPSPTASYQWYCGTTPIGTNSATHTVTSADAAAACIITVVITETNGVGSPASATSGATGAVIVPTLATPTDLVVRIIGSSVVATFSSVTNATSYRCTLMYGFDSPTTFSYVSSTPTCSFAGIDLTRAWGIAVVALNVVAGWTPSNPAVGFAQLPPAGTSPSNGSGSGAGTTPHATTAVYFAPNSTRLNDTSQARLSHFGANVIHMNLHVLNIVGYTDPTGALGANLRLGKRRADIVAAFLHRYFSARGFQAEFTLSSGGVNAASTNLALDRVASVSAQ
jgi:hypothetical protein